MKDKIKELRKKGFTLIELIVVIAVLGILVLLAAPKFLGYTADAKLKQIQNDIRVYDSQATVELMKNPNLESTWTELTEQQIQEMNTSGKVINKKGEVVSNLLTEDNYVLDLKEINSDLNGIFIWTSNDDVVYYDENSSAIGNNPGNEVGENNGTTDPDDQPVLLTDADFEWVEDYQGYFTTDYPTTKGYYKYTGSDEENVKIPDIIHGTPMTSYYRMFSGTGANLKKVVSTNKNVENMSNMFEWVMAETLDLSELDTSNVKSMSKMFSNAQSESIDFSGWDTSKVETMFSMFENSMTELLDLSSFDTGNVTNMGYMFKITEATEIDVSSFDTKNVTSMYQMFQASKATSLDLRNWDTRNVTNMGYMFTGAAAKSLDLSSFDTSNVKSMSAMFWRSEAETITFGSNFTTTNVTDMYTMFSESAAKELDLRTFDTTNVTEMRDMFKDAQATVGYAGSQTEADKFNGTSNKPSTLSFEVK